ncbi:PREDICTED: nuclear inhibitor of protein phosphatase 1-like [Amphimedon queenslandica]|uniref:FHA domain-containing protein n=1 Tax=Amphimedon queenslandica TaxID=400682 RepID=A0A1X7VNH8_AMPQE|nr:PREDICTED: nuclear inhibitor of protein phosphatase 1-like [Amphimedon queenslandica]|eukprot:XP_003383524.1 PREDICTED: nuclear inhibitor of protein phosphatase 1-like [Amphimedon queenslandica]
MSSEFKPPDWIGPPKPGLHLDVVKNGTVLQKLLIDDKEYYLFGRNTDVCDFPLHHQSCSRVHAALVHHKYLNRPFLIDLGSAHGSFVGSMQLEAQKPQQLLEDCTFSFGASTRKYTLREKPQQVSLLQEEGGEGEGGTLLGIADLDNEVDDITQYNTAHNRQISTIGINEEASLSRKRQRKSSSVSFNETEEIINPEDVDPSVGRFRNLVQSSVVIPAKRTRSDDDEGSTPLTPTSSKRHPFTQPLSSPTDPLPPSSSQLYPDGSLLSPSSSRGTLSFSSVLSRGITAAPPVENPEATEANSKATSSVQPTWSVSQDIFEDSEVPRKKKYAKEAWPGKKPTHNMMI